MGDEPVFSDDVFYNQRYTLYSKRKILSVFNEPVRDGSSRPVIEKIIIKNVLNKLLRQSTSFNNSI
jgi:hypothetical protein